MGLADALNSELERINTRKCLMRRLLDTMNDEDREAFEIAATQIVEHRKISGTPNQWTPITASSLWRALTQEGYAISRDAVWKHLSDTCMCHTTS